MYSHKYTGFLWLNIFVSLIFILTSCQSKTGTKEKRDPIQTFQTVIGPRPDFDYTIKIPEGWTTRDTMMPNGIQFRFLLSPRSLIADYPAGNILISSMEGLNIDDFTTNNIKYLNTNLPGTIILKRGYIDFSTYNGQWFTYTKQQGGVVRDMINYIIPVKGFAYMITFGTNKGSIDKYRSTFDRITKSFKVAD